MMDVVVPIYQSEISPAHSRGRMVGAHGFLIVVGYVSASTSRLVLQKVQHMLTDELSEYGSVDRTRLLF